MEFVHVSNINSIQDVGMLNNGGSVIKKNRRFPFLMLGVLAAVVGCGLVVGQVAAVRTRTVQLLSVPAAGIVTDTQSRPVARARVYFIDTTLINTTSPMTAAGILNGSTEGYDEPLEDIIANAALAKTIPQASTNLRGKFKVSGLKTNLMYYVFVKPGTQDTEHLPGGDLSRLALSPNAVPRIGVHIQLSWTPPADATYIGTSACYVCHADKPNFKKHAHQVGLQAAGTLTANQDLGAHPSMGEFLAKFTPATAYTDSGVKVLFYEDYDGTRYADKFKVFEDTTGGGKVYMKVYLWNAAGAYQVTLVNQLNPNDVPLTLNVKLTYGGAFFRQLLLVDAPGRKGRYPFLQFQAFSDQISKGKDSYYDQTRRVFRDYDGARFFSPGPDGQYGTADDVLALPSPAETFEGQCAGCHFTGYTATKDAATQELLASAVPDINGAFDAAGNGQLEEVNVGCEACHGPGSAHRSEALKAATEPSRGKINYKGKFIVNPALLGADRANMICGRCHDQVLGNSQLGVREVPLNNLEQFPLPGISRSQYLAQYVSRKTFALDELWQDGIHPKIHRGQYFTWLQSQHARNTRQMVACDNCHDNHGDSNFERFLLDDPTDPNSTLCQSCHAIDVASHTLQYTGSVMIGASQTCVACHMERTARSGAGLPGLVLGTPSGTASDANLFYWRNDLASHVMDVPTKFSAAGVQPGTAMPVPYTNACGTCHDPSKLQYQQNPFGGTH